MVAKFLGGIDDPINESQGGTGATTVAQALDNFGISSDIIEKNNNYLAVTADRGKFLHFTGAGPYTLTLSLSTSLGAGWIVNVRNDTASALTIARTAPDTINGAASITLQVGQSIQIFCDGISAFYTAGFFGTSPSGALLIANNLSDLSNVATARANLGDSQVINAQTLAYTALLADRGKVIRYTGAGGVTLSLTAAATLGNGWWVTLRNDSTGVITIDPNGAELINGAATITVDAAQAIIIYCNGTTFYTVGEYLAPLHLSGGTMTGSLILAANPGVALEAATKQYVDSAVGGGAPVGATYITQTPNGTLTNEQALSPLATGILKSTTGTGVISIAVNGTDYYGPATPTKIPVTDGGTGVGTFTPFAVICGGTAATNPLQSIAGVGTSGQVLTSNGAGALPTFQSNPAGTGALVFLSSGTASNSATINFDSLLSSTYDNYLIVFESIIPATNGNSLRSRVGTAGPVYQSTNYQGIAFLMNTGGGAGTASTTNIALTYSNDLASTANRGTGGTMTLSNVNDATNFKSAVSLASYMSSANTTVLATAGGAQWQGATVVNSVQFLMNSGNITSGIFKLYGIKNS